MFIGGGTGGVGRIGGGVRLRAGAGAIPTFGAGQVQGITFGNRNGDSLSGMATIQRYVGGLTLTNLFGNRNNANTAGGALPGALIIKVRLQPGMLYSGSASSTYNQLQVLFGSSSTSTRNLRLSYVPAQAGSTNLGFRGRFVWQGAFANGSRIGDRAAATGNTGDTSSTSGLRTAVVDSNLAVDDTVLVALRLVPDGGGGFLTRADHVLPDGTLVPGDTFAQTATAGIATPGSAFDFGRFSAAAVSIQNCFMGALGDFVQIDNYTVTDAELIRMARGESPTSIWSAGVLALWYRMGGPSDLAQTGGFKTGATLTAVGGSLLQPGPALGGAVDPATGRGIWLRPHCDGFVHGLNPTAVRACTSAAQVAALTGEMAFQVRLFGGGTTHVWARVRRGATIIATERLTTTPVGDGEYLFYCPNVPAGSGYVREVVREDALTAVCRDSNDHRVGIHAVITGQSQTNIGFYGAAPGAPSLSTTGKVSFIECKGFAGASIENVPAYGGVLDRLNVFGTGVHTIVNAWETATSGVDLPLMMTVIYRNGTSRKQWCEDRVAEGSGSATFPWTGDIWGDGTNWTTGLVTRCMLKTRGMVTMFHEAWSTDDRSAIASDPAYFPAIMNKFYGGIGRTGAQGAMTQFNLRWRPFVVIIPVDRHRNNAAASPDLRDSVAGQVQTARERMRAYALGTGVDPSMDAEMGGYNLPYAIFPQAESTHQDRTNSERGTVRYMEFYANSLMRGARARPANGDGGFASASRAGNVITLTAERPNGGTLDTYITGGTPLGFEVSEDGGVTWTRTGFTAAIVGGTVTLTKGSGNWAANTRVAHLWGYPWHIGSGTSATDVESEAAAGANFVVEVANGRRYPLRPTFTDLVAA